MWLRLAVTAAATIVMMQAQTWEVAPVAGYLRLSKKPIGSASTIEPKDDDTKLTARQPVYGLRLNWNTSNYYGIEASYLRAKARIDAKLVPTDGNESVLQTGTVWIDQVFLNGISYFMPRGERFRPYMTAGANLQLYRSPHLADWTRGPAPKTIGFNYGGGIKIRLFKSALVRLDVRDIWGGSPYDLSFDTEFGTGGRYRQLAATLGLGITF